MRKKTVTLTVKLTVEVKDGYDEMNAEELEGVLQDMDYPVGRTSGIRNLIQRDGNRNYGLGILEYNNEICKM